MTVSDYIVEYLINQRITDVFGYPGGMVIHLMDSFSKYGERICVHVSYNEQGDAMAVCGYAQASGKVGVAYATSGPGATNLITGVCNAYMDSIPTLFITGQVNSFEQKGKMRLRQKEFQETDIVLMVKSCTKYAACINDAASIRIELDKAFQFANENRKGPVLLIGNGLKRDKMLLEDLDSLGIPIVSSMIAVDCRGALKNFFGFVGAYGDRSANFVAKSDLVISLGVRLDVRQVGIRRENFALNSKLIRIDIDEAEIDYKVHDDEISFCADAAGVVKQILEFVIGNFYNFLKWVSVCDRMKKYLDGIDDKEPNEFVKKISEKVEEDAIITTDVGQNQVWVAQSFRFKGGQRAFFSEGHGAMGYFLPATIGVQIASGRKFFCFNGDGGIQMNIQELQMLSRETAC